MRIHPLLPVLVLAIAIVGTVFVSVFEKPAAPPSIDLQAAAIATPNPAPMVESIAPLPENLAEKPLANEASLENQRAKIAVDPIDSAVGPLIHVVVGASKKTADGKSGVAGIAVHWIELNVGIERRADEQQKRKLDPQLVPDLDLAQRYGAASLTDENGNIRLPPMQSATVVSVLDAKQHRFASIVLQPDQTEALLVLVADETLLVRVRDVDLRLQSNVPIGIYRGEKFGAGEAIWQGHSQPNGIAAIPHFQQLRNKAKGARFAAVIALPLLFPAGVEFAGSTTITEPIDLLLPRTIPVLLHVRHPSGAALRTEVPISLKAVRPEKFTLPLPVGDRFDIVRATKPVGEDVAEFPHLQLGIEVVPYLRFPDLGNPVALPAMLLPANSTSPLELTLFLPADLSVLAGVATQTDGSPIANGRIAYSMVQTRGGIMGGSFLSLQDGRFDFVLRVRDPSNAISPQFRAPDVDGLVLMARATPLAMSKGERRDLGVVVFQPAELLVHGDVRNDQGEPVADAAVHLEWLLPTRRGPDGWSSAGDGQVTTATTDAAGNFALLGMPLDKQMRLLVNKTAHQPFASEPFGKGSRLHVRLVRNGVLRGFLLLPSWLPKNAATLQLHSATEQQRTASLQLASSGAFALDGLIPDTYTAQITIRNLPKPLFELTQVQISSGENRESQLDPLDLTQSLFRYCLRAMGPFGPLNTLDGPILWTGNKANNQPVAFRWQKGKAELITQVAMMEFTTVSQGILPCTFTIASGDHDIYLKQVQPVILNLPGIRALCGYERAIRVSLVRVADSGLPQGLSGIDQQSNDNFSFPRWYLGKSGGGWLDERDHAEATVSMNGPHEVILRVYADAKKDGPQTSISIGTIEVVVDGLLPRSQTLAFDSNKIAKAVLGLSQQLRDTRSNGSR